MHAARSDADTIRLTCSLANELVDALALPEAKRRAGIEATTRRYAKTLGLSLREVMEALNPGAARPGQATPASAAAGAPAGAPAASLRDRLGNRGH